MIKAGLLILVTVIALSPVIATSSNSFASNSDLNDNYSYGFPEDDFAALIADLAASEPIPKKERARYTTRHREIIKELVETRKIPQKDGNSNFCLKSLASLFLEAEAQFKSENLVSMNRRSFQAYLHMETYGKWKHPNTRRGPRKSLTAAHEAILDEVFKKYISESQISKAQALQEISNKVNAKNLEPINRNTVLSRMRSHREKKLNKLIPR